MPTRHIGVREFRDQATRHIASGDVLAIERHGALVGYFVPVEPPGQGEAIEAAVARLKEEAGRVDVLAELRSRRDELLDICARHGASSVQIFGSVARGEATTRSDIDLLVSFEPGRSLIDLGGLIADLEELLNRSVDVVTLRSLKPDIRRSVLDEATPL